MDSNSLLNIVIDKEKRIEELERLVEEQKKLRLQDASQVEEKAARIKEWVANKLKELENQNKLLRDQNKKQKEIIEILSKQLASLKTPSKKQQLSELPYIDNHTSKQIVRDNTLTRESPVYDSVNIETSAAQQQPPPLPLHQSDKWELQLYSLADETLSLLINKHSLEDNNQHDSLLDSRKSSLCSKNDLNLLVKPSFTTIDGDHVVDSLDYDDDELLEYVEEDTTTSKPSLIRKDSLFQRSIDATVSSQQNHKKLNRKESFDSYDVSSKSLTQQAKSLTPNLFDSPMRTRAGKDASSILRTQSVRKNPAPRKLYDFILADLVKRGYLIKSGALKNHNRWFVLKNFHLYLYKSESEETLKTTPHLRIRLDFNCHIQQYNASSSSHNSTTSDTGAHFPFRITYLDKSLQLIANSAATRDEWIRILTVTINMSDIEPDNLTKANAIHEGIMSVTKHGHSKRYYAVLVNHIVFFLKSISDPTPTSYVSVKEAKIREITDNYDYDHASSEHQNQQQQKSYDIQDCSLAIYPKYSMSPDPIYITLGNQQETDKWFYFLSAASNIDQAHGTQFERALTKIMLNYSITNFTATDNNSEIGSNCLWREHPLMLYSDRPITESLTSLPNETLRAEAIELFKSVQLFTQVALEPIAIDYHVSLLKNCLNRFLEHPELRNEFYAQLIKQSTWILHKCISPKSSIISNESSNDSISPVNGGRSSMSSSLSSPRSSECQLLTDLQVLDSILNERDFNRRRYRSSMSCHTSSAKDKNDSASSEDMNNNQYKVPPSQSELVQVMQIIAVAVSLNLPSGRIRWWLIDHLKKFADPQTKIGKYALYTLKAIDRTILNGPRDNIPSRTEIMSILLRNPYDHSNPHSLPVNFTDGSYLVIGADGSTTVEEFMNSMTKDINIRHSLVSDFYLFSDDPSGLSKELHILEPKRKVLDIVGWWEEAFRKQNSGRYQNTRFIKFLCKKRLVLKAEIDETPQERLLIAHQVNQEIVSGKISLNENLTLELGAIMAQLNFGDFNKNSTDQKTIRCILSKITSSFLPNQTDDQKFTDNDNQIRYYQLIEKWKHLTGKAGHDCVRVYLNCIRRLNNGQI